jgi:4-hydroxyacetophenone monooxygenase
MPVQHSAKPFDEDAQAIREMLRDAVLVPLLPALAHLTGDMSLLVEGLRPALGATAGSNARGGMSFADEQKARELALSAILAFRDNGYRPASDPSPAQLQQLMEFVAGQAPGAYLPLLRHELGLPADMGAPRWTKDEVAPGREFRAVVIGAGQSGLVTAHRLAQAGIEFVVLEKNPEVGGTWYENSYPGCRLDTSNFAYSFSFAQKSDWPQDFSPRDAILRYFKDVAREFDLLRCIRFETEVLAAEFDDDTELWTVTVRNEHGAEERLTADAVITAMGQLNRPKLPDIPGRESFAGKSWHTARWNHEEDLTGRRVAVIGTGASAYQVVPSIADQVGELTVFQRTPPWMRPQPNYHQDIAPGLRWLFEHVPYYARWFRFFQVWMSVEGQRPFVVVDPEWTHEISVSEKNEGLRQELVRHLEEQFGDRPDLLAKVMPAYPPGAKRMMRDNGVWPAALKKDHVHLVVDGIVEITPTGIRTADGTVHEVDVIIYATGFRASEYLSPIRVTGRGGLDLHEHWAGEPRAYMGLHIPRFPNLFCILGPNTGLVINGSIILFSEMAVHYILECFRLLLTDNRRTIAVRADVHDAWNEGVDRANRLMAWGASSVSSWYKNDNGRVSQVWPYHLLDYWELTRAPRPEHLVIT